MREMHTQRAFNNVSCWIYYYYYTIRARLCVESVTVETGVGLCDDGKMNEFAVVLQPAAEDVEEKKQQQLRLWPDHSWAITHEMPCHERSENIEWTTHRSNDHKHARHRIGDGEVRRPSLWPLCVSTEAYLSDIRVCMVVFSGEARNGHKHVHTNIYPHLTHAQGFFLLLFLLLDNMFGILARAAHSHTERGT